MVKEKKMALKKDINYNTLNGEVLTTYHILAGVFIDYKAPNGGNIVAIIQSYKDAQDREENLHSTPYRVSIPLAGHQTEKEFFLVVENESVLQKCYEALKYTPQFIGAEDC